MNFIQAYDSKKNKIEIQTEMTEKHITMMEFQTVLKILNQFNRKCLILRVVQTESGDFN